jgi:GTPase
LLALHHDGELLDRRILDPTWGANAEDVKFVLDSSTRIEATISGGEQATIEFKRELPEKNPVGFLKTVAAFANGAGGTILFGVADDGEIVGVGHDQRRSNQDRLTKLITARVRPCRTSKQNG